MSASLLRLLAMLALYGGAFTRIIPGKFVMQEEPLAVFHVHRNNNFNQSAEGAGGLGIIRGNEVGESE